MNVWIITVNFVDTQPTKSLIDSLSFDDTSDSIRVGIADNSTSDKSHNELQKITQKTKLDISIFPNKKNLYYWPAAKKVINSLKDSIGSYPDWVIICNNDITFADNNFFEKLAEIDIKKYPIIGPNIINSSGKQLNPFMKHSLSALEKIYWKIYFISYPISLLMITIRKLLTPFIPDSNRKNLIKNKKVYAVHGSAIFFSNYFFKQGGFFDDNFEMYGEELTVAEIAKKLNMPVTYFPTIKIIHEEHSSTKILSNRYLFDKARASYKYFESVYLK